MPRPRKKSWPKTIVDCATVLFICLFTCAALLQWRAGHRLRDHQDDKQAVASDAVQRVASPSSHAVTSLQHASALVANVDSKKDALVTILLIPSEVLGERRLLRLQTIARTWGTAAHNLGIRIVALCSEAEVKLYEKDLPSLFGAIELLAVPTEHVKQSDLLQNVFLGWLDHGPTLDQEMWALKHLTAQALPDWIIVANDAVFVLPSNLACFLRRLDPAHLTYTGHVLKTDYKGGTPFASTGSGAVLSGKAARLMSGAWSRGQDGARDKGAADCISTNKWEETNPAVILAACAKSLGIKAGDDRNGKESRFHIYGPVRSVSGNTDTWYQSFHQKNYGEPPRIGSDCCAADSVSFHYVEDKEAEFLWQVLVSKRDEFLAMDASSLYGAYPKELGPYAHAPKPSDKMWDLLLHKLVMLNPDTCT